MGPVNPKIIPTLTSAKVAVVIVDKHKITASSNFLIFPPKKILYVWLYKAKYYLRTVNIS